MFSSISINLFGQNYFNLPPAKDLAEIKEMSVSTDKIDQIVRYARNPKIFYNEEVKNLIEEALITAANLKREDLKEVLISTKAIIELNLGNNDAAINLIKQAETFLPKLNELQTAVLYSDLTRIYNRTGDYEKSFIYFDKLDSFVKDKPQFIIQRVLNLRNRTSLEMRTGHTEQIRTNYDLALKLSKESNNGALLKDTRFAYANVLLNIHKEDEAFTILKDLIPDLENTISDRTSLFFDILSRNFEKTGDYKNAFAYSEKLFNLPNATILQKGNSINRMILFSYQLNNYSNFDSYFTAHKKYGMDENNLISKKQYELAEARYYDFKKNNKIAKQTYFKALNLKLRKEIAPNFDLDILTGLGTLYANEGKTDSSSFYFKKAEDLLNKYRMPPIYRFKYLEAAKNAKIHQTTNQDTLIRNLKNEILLKDTLNQIRLSSITDELETKYRVTEKERELELARKQQQLQQLEIKQQKQKGWLIIIAAVIGILILSGIAYIINQRKKQAAIIYNSNLSNLENKHRIEIMNTLTDVQEKEKKRIAERLHDEVGAMLSIAKLNINTLKINDFVADSEIENKLQVTKNLMTDISETVRNISHTLMPIALEKYGFKAALLDLLSAIKAANSIHVEYFIEGLDKTQLWPQNFTLSTYRIVQELLNNAIKHAEATHLFVQIIELDHSITIFIEDNGKGLTPENMNNESAGMTLLKTNVDYLLGKLEINGKPNEGTFALIELPIPKIIDA